MQLITNNAKCDNSSADGNCYEDILKYFTKKLKYLMY